MYSHDNVGRNTIAMVLAGGNGERLSPLTHYHVSDIWTSELVLLPQQPDNRSWV